MFEPQENRYQEMVYRRCGKSGVLLPALSLGLWHNFGAPSPLTVQQDMLRTAFDHGITHFDLANNYGPPYGEAEANFGRLMDLDWRPYRDELFLATKAGYDMWPGPYGNWGSRKYLVASIDQSLRRMKTDYVDVFYHHRPDPATPIEETMGALDYIVRSGRALYAGISNYGPEETRRALRELKRLGTPCLIHQVRYSLLDRHLDDGLSEVLQEEGVGCIVFQPLAGGLLTGKYLDSIPADSRMAADGRYLRPSSLTEETMRKLRGLKAIADQRGQKMHHMALQWVLRDEKVTSALIGARTPEQILDNLQALSAPPLTREEMEAIESALR